MRTSNNLLDKEQINHLNSMVRHLQSEQLSIFAGAGVSIGSGFVDWKGLMRPIIDQLGVNPNIDLSLVAQFYDNEYNRYDINDLIFNEFNKKHKSNEIIKKLGKLPIKSYWTTNYDSLIEDTLSSEPISKKVHTVKEKNQFKYKSPDTDVIVYKMHGDKSEPDYAVITKNDYETYDEKRDVFTKALFTELITNTFLFIGFSFSDPNLERILSIVKHTFDKNTLDKNSPRNHYCFMRRVQEKDYNDLESEQFNQDKNYQNLRIKEMISYGIQTILIDDFSQIAICLDYMKSKLDQKRVFISGSIKQNIDNNSDEAVLIQNLAQRLVERGYKIVTGFGQNLGNYLFIGACLNKNINQMKNLHTSIEAYPLVSFENNIQMLRKELISDCGSIITLFGKTEYENTLKDEDVKDDGVYKEFKIAEEAEKTLIPIAATGYTSKYLWESMNHSLSNYYNNDQILSAWNNLNISIRKNKTIIDSIIKIIEQINVVNQEKLEQQLLSFTVKKRIFLSFHYNKSHILAREIRKSINNTHSYVATEEEQIEDRLNKNKIQGWIDDKLENTVATVLIYDKEIYYSQYIEYEILMSLERKNILIIIVPNKDNKNNIKNELFERFDINGANMKIFHMNEFKTPEIIEKKLNSILY